MTYKVRGEHLILEMDLVRLSKDGLAILKNLQYLNNLRGCIGQDSYIFSPWLGNDYWVN
jgi:hypothetical protein